MFQTNGADVAAHVQSAIETFGRVEDGSGAEEASEATVVPHAEEGNAKLAARREPKRDAARLIDLERRAKFGRFGSTL